jgi:hypothetical protein
MTSRTRIAAGVAIAAATASVPNAATIADAALAPAMTKEPIAILQGLDKITARVSRFAAPVGQAVKLGTLSIVVRDCEKSAPEDRPENAAFLQIYENRPGEAPVRRFSGWMFSSSPALSALEHPVYDVNLLECEPTAAAAAASSASASGAAPRQSTAVSSPGNAAR